MYKLTVSDNQLRVIGKALEWYFRTSMGQFFDYADEVALNGYEYDKNNPENDKLFNEYINRRNNSQELFEQAYNIAAPDFFKRRKTPDMMTAIDLWHVIRHQWYLERPEPKDHWTVDADKPRSWTGESLMRIERTDDA